MSRIALKGFSLVRLFPITENSLTAYKTEGPFLLPHAQELSKENDAKGTDIYADDALYMHVQSFTGIKANLTLAEISLELMEKLGFGIMNKTKQSLLLKPEGMNKQFAMSFRSQRADGLFRMQKMFVFHVNELVESSFKTMGQDVQLQNVQIKGVFGFRKKDNSPGEVKDANDLTWLESMEAL